MSTPESMMRELASDDGEIRGLAANQLLEIIQPSAPGGEGALLREVDSSLDGKWWIESLASAFENANGKYSEAPWLLSKFDGQTLAENLPTVFRLIEKSHSIAALRQLVIAIEKASWCNSGAGVREACRTARNRVEELRSSNNEAEAFDLIAILNRIC